MADQCGEETLEGRSNFIENSMKDRLEFIERAAVMNELAEKKYWITELFGEKDKSLCENVSLSSRGLTHLPSEFGVYLKNLIYLDLSNNKLATVPFSLKFIATLEILILDRNCMRTLPLTLVDLSCLRVLRLSDNFVEKLPARLGDLTALDTLILSRNKISSLPESCNKLNRLKILDLSDNCFKQLPSYLDELLSLETLNLSSNRIAELPTSWSRLNKLKSLDLSSNRFKKFPFCITKGMQSLERLDTSDNHHIDVTTAPASAKLRKLYIREVGTQTKFPLWIFTGCASVLELLDLEGTKFESFRVPDNCPSLNIRTLILRRCSLYDTVLQELTSSTDKLERLIVGNGNSKQGGNAFWSMPIQKLRHPELVTEIDVRSVGLTHVSGEIKEFINLVKLDMGNNNLGSLGNDICCLERLEVLIIDETHLTELPENIDAMSSLREVRASSNYLCSLPKSLGDLKKLTYLDLYENEFCEMPTEVQSLGNLLGLDLDRNSFMINDNDFIGHKQYATVRKAVRDRCSKSANERRTGPRYDSDTKDQYDASSSNNSSIACYEWKINVEENLEDHVIAEEDWDNSADEFEPTKVNPSWACSWSSIERQRAMGKTAFCPADLHVQSVRPRAARMRARGEIKDDLIIQEGQFEDA